MLSIWVRFKPGWKLLLGMLSIRAQWHQLATLRPVEDIFCSFGEFSKSYWVVWDVAYHTWYWCQDIKDSYMVEKGPKNSGKAPPPFSGNARKNFFLRSLTFQSRVTRDSVSCFFFTEKRWFQWSFTEKEWPLVVEKTFSNRWIAKSRGLHLSRRWSSPERVSLFVIYYIWYLLLKLAILLNC